MDSLIKASSSVRRIRLTDCLTEITKGVGLSWKNYQVLGATREGLALAKESVGKEPERYKLVEPGTIFYNPMRILIGSIAFVDEGKEPGITSPDYVAFKTKPGVMHPRWFYYWLRSDDGAAFIKTLARGAVRERMLFRRLAAAEIVLPPYEVQAKFAEQVLSIQRARAAAEAQLNAAKALPAAYVRALFNSPEAQQWPSKRLGEVCKFLHGGTPSKANPSYWNGKIPWVSPKDMRSRLISDTQDRISEEAVASSNTCVVPAGTILAVIRSGILARTFPMAITGMKVSFNQDIKAVLPNLQRTNLQFLYWTLVHYEPHILVYGVKKGATVHSIRSGFLESLEIPCPILDEQQHIVARINGQMTATDRTRKAVEDQLATINKLPAALLREAFSGRIGPEVGHG